MIRQIRFLKHNTDFTDFTDFFGRQMTKIRMIRQIRCLDRPNPLSATQIRCRKDTTSCAMGVYLMAKYWPLVAAMRT